VARPPTSSSELRSLAVWDRRRKLEQRRHLQEKRGCQKYIQRAKKAD